MKPRLVDICHRCGHKHEDAKHILECKAPEAVEIWRQEINKLDLWLRSEATCPQLRLVLIEVLTAWKMGTHSTQRIESTYTGL